ncbi:MAG: NUDIX hydrolase [Dehalococcoidia bacterium]
MRSRLVYESPWLRAHDDEVTLPDGSPGVYTWVDYPSRMGGSLVIPRLPDGRLLLVKVHRYPVDRESWEFPGGAATPGETPEETAARELLEETGLTANRLTMLGRLAPDPAIIGVLHSVVLADLPGGIEPNLRLQDDEPINDARFVTMSEAWSMVKSGEMFNSGHVAALGMLGAVSA